MDAVEIARLHLDVDGKDATTAFKELQEEAKAVSREVRDLKKNIDDWTDDDKARYTELITRQKELKAEVKAYTAELDINDASMNELVARSRLLNKELKDLKVGSDEWLDKLKEVKDVDGKIAEVRNEIKGLNDEGEKGTSVWGDFKNGFMGAFIGSGVYDIVTNIAGAVFDFGKEIFEITAKFEKYEAVLANSLGSQEKAAQAMADIKKFAQETPFSVDELTESYIKYVNRGLQPSMEEMNKLGDIAASQGKSFDQLTEAVLDAGTGEFERLKEFGIQAHKNGEIVEMSFRGINQTVANTPEAIQAAILSFGEMEGVSGSMAAQMNTLEGQTSNLGDNFDSLKVTLGEKLAPVFSGIIEAMNFGITVIKDLFADSSLLSESFSSLWDILSSLWDSVKSLFMSLLDLQTGGRGVTGVMDALSLTFNVVGTALRVLLSIVQIAVDGFNFLLNKGKEVANFFGAEFKIDQNATFERLAQNASKNFDAIKKTWTDTNEAGVKSSIETNAKVDADHKKTQTSMTATAAAEAKKRADEAKKNADKEAADREKANADATKRIEDNRITFIKNDLERNLAAENIKYERAKAAIEKNKADEILKAKELEQLNQKHSDTIAKIKEDARKKEKEAEDKIAKEQEAARKKLEADEKKYRDDKLKEEKLLLDATFKAEIEKAKLSLSLTKDNAKAQYDEKLRLLELESKYRSEQLKKQAEEEKNRIKDSIKDHDAQKTALLAIDDKLKAQEKANETKLQEDKKKLQAEANALRKKNNDEFFEALNSAMQGDLSKFLNFLAQKLSNEKATNNARLSDFAQKASAMLDVMNNMVGVLKTLNQQWLTNSISRIDTEKAKQIAAWDAQYKSGKITKEQYDQYVSKANKKADAEVLEARKKAFEKEKAMNIAMAVINGAQTALKSFAMMGWPLGLIAVAGAAIATALQVKAIRNAQFQGRKGVKYTRNAGVLDGPSHGNKYGDSGIAMIDRSTGIEVGEAEGGEPFMILSRDTYKNNGKVIDRLLHSSLHRNGAPITMRKGGYLALGDVDYYNRYRKFKDGDWIDPREDGDGGAAITDPNDPAIVTDPSYDYGGGDPGSGYTGGGGVFGGDASSDRQLLEQNIEVNRKMGEDISRLLDEARETNNKLAEANDRLLAIANKPDGPSAADIAGAVASRTAATSSSTIG